ncbi:MAG: DUF4186 family protein, partial [Cyanobacteria bacterium]|nr:DUF4186 family protein [Cyanobacteriota bacterium]
MHGNLDGLFERLQKNDFRRRFRLSGTDVAYLRDKGLVQITEH